MSVLLERPYVCPVCQRKVRELFPLTRYDKTVGRWVATKACLPCCGPEGTESPGLNLGRLFIER